MSDEKKSLESKDLQKKKPKRKSIFKTKETDIFNTSNHNFKTRFRLTIFLLFACLSSITISAKIAFTPVVSYALSEHLRNSFPVNQLEWIGRLYSIVVLCLIPITTSLIDYWMISYRFSLVIAGSLHVVACVTNSTVTHPLFYVLTDSLICALGSAITFSVFFLAIDDLFPKGTKLRVFTTTMCQGSTIFSLFIPGMFAYVSKHWGWMIFQLTFGGIFCLEAVVMILSSPEYGMHVRVKRRGGPLSMEPTVTLDMSSAPAVSNRLLGLTFIEINRSPSMFPFLVYRFSISIIHQGVSSLVLNDSGIITNPNFTALILDNFPTTCAAIVYAASDTTLFILGAFLGVFFLGYLLHINIAFLCLLFLASVIWQPIRLQVESQSMIIGHIICAGITGACIGALDSCTTTLAEEGTVIPSRRVYPFVKLLEGLAYTFTPFLFHILDSVSEKNIWLLTFSLMAASNACLLVFILHKLYTSYRTESMHHKVSIQASMKPIQFFSRRSESN